MAQSEFTMDDISQRFSYKKTLNVDALAKKVVLLGEIEGKDAILTLEKTPFKESGELNLEQLDLIANNDIYYWAMATLRQDLKLMPAAKANLIYPATEKHIRKYQKAIFHMVKETPDVYSKVVKPYIATQKGDNIKWVDNILYKGAEADRVLFKNNDYVVLPDMKWDGKTVQSLYCCAIVFDSTIASIRDLNETHISYLERIQESLLSEISSAYAKDGITRDKLRLYVHYQPTYYHFHIHIVHVDFDGLPGSMAIGKAIALNDVIEDLKVRGKEGMLTKTLVYSISESHELFHLGLNNHLA